MSALQRFRDRDPGVFLVGVALFAFLTWLWSRWVGRGWTVLHHHQHWGAVASLLVIAFLTLLPGVPLLLWVRRLSSDARKAKWRVKLEAGPNAEAVVGTPRGWRRLSVLFVGAYPFALVLRAMLGRTGLVLLLLPLMGGLLWCGVAALWGGIWMTFVRRRPAVPLSGTCPPSQA